ncbi:MAG: hypothetical protein J0L92_06095 [Deltaproteobacteria bacterium]|nr:hypothetical protein [Deltaproteobacteria bacterium]
MRGDDGKRWLVRKEGQDHGPFAALEILVLIRKGELGPEHELLDVKTREAKPVSQWPGVQRALEDRRRVVAQEAGRAARAALDRRTRMLLAARTGLLVLVAIAAIGLLISLGLEGGERLDLRVVGLSTLYALVLGASVVFLEREGSQASESAFRSESSPTTLVICGALALLTAAPLALLAPFAAVEPSIFGDELGHAEVAVELARSGLSRGWVAGPLAGFPFGLHEPGLVPLLVRALIALGLTPIGATHALGTLGALLTPLAAYVAAVRASVRPVYALLGAMLLAWTAPNTPFAGGFEAFFEAGLLGSTLALPLCMIAAAEIVRAEVRWIAPLLLVIGVLLSPPLVVFTLVLTALGNAVGGHGAGLRETLRASLATLAISVAIYGQGFLDLGVPFGPPPELAWRRVGFPIERLDAWLLGGDLLDHARTPVLSYVAIAAILALVLLIKRPSARAGLVLVGVALAWPVLARMLFGESGGPMATAAISWLVPVHAIAIAPVMIALSLSIVLEEAAPRLEQIVEAWAPALDRIAGIAALAVVGGVLALALPERIAFATRTRGALDSRRELPCGAVTPEGYVHGDVAALLGSLEGGRLWYASDSLALAQCVELDGLALDSAVPLAASPSAGSHVGSTWLAFSRLEPSREGASARAEALGVRHVLETSDVEPPPSWTASEPRGGLRVLSHAPATTLVGVGCVIETWRGDDEALREHLREELSTAAGADRVLSPTALVALDRSRGGLVVTVEPQDDCDASRARVNEVPRESGALEAEIESATPIDVVLRVTAFRSWGVLVDGTEIDDVRLVAPGFLSVRVGAGRHRVVARASGVPWFWTGLLLAIVLAVLVAFAKRESLERKMIPRGDRDDPWRATRRR